MTGQGCGIHFIQHCHPCNGDDTDPHWFLSGCVVCTSQPLSVGNLL
ncbi:hypothetical protein NP493_201g03000 [Ridgeia piscesae]|uniref:Uncharacterized protein n=1 Tax=Ridgeia piscesae TaxID=27915 RepID=A0AAD9UEJ6_RIDPI|nr:hypothetical protein NP493_201g03000 [Ridgeia piscesae]